MFGNERRGVSKEAVAAADGSIVIPTSGFAQSLNISVAAALVLYSIQQQRISRAGRHATVTPEESQLLAAVMLLRDQVQHVSSVHAYVCVPGNTLWMFPGLSGHSSGPMCLSATLRTFLLGHLSVGHLFTLSVLNENCLV
jgi:hypothetical protein